MTAASLDRPRSLVLGGGGMVGVGWHVGVLSGLAEAGIDLAPGAATAADIVLGTSAGSIVGALLTAATSYAELHRLAISDATTEVAGEATALLDFALMAECFGVWTTLPDTSAAQMARVGMYAIKAPTVTEDRWVGSFTDISGTTWPDAGPSFRCTAVDVESGEFRIWDGASGVALDRAVASSCTVPAIFPPVTIAGSRYMDGGVRSGTNADHVPGSRSVLILAPIGSNAADPLDAAAKRQLDREAAALRAEGADVTVLLPDAEANAATLRTLLGRMDPTMRLPAIEHGRRQGRALAETLAAAW